MSVVGLIAPTSHRMSVVRLLASTTTLLFNNIITFGLFVASSHLAYCSSEVHGGMAAFVQLLCAETVV